MSIWGESIEICCYRLLGKVVELGALGPPRLELQGLPEQPTRRKADISRTQGPSDRKQPFKLHNLQAASLSCLFATASADLKLIRDRKESHLPCTFPRPGELRAAPYR